MKWKVVPFPTALTYDVWKSCREVRQKFQVTKHFQIMLFLTLIVLPLKYPCILSWDSNLVLWKVTNFSDARSSLQQEKKGSTVYKLVTDIHMTQYKEFNEGT